MAQVGRKQDRNNYSTSQKEVIISLWTSFLVHMVLLLILAFIYEASYIPKSPKIELSFSVQEEIVSMDIWEQFPEIESLDVVTIDSGSVLGVEDSDIVVDNQYEELLPKNKTPQNESVGVKPIKSKPAGSKNKPSKGIVDLNRRLKRAGAKTGDIQISISWDNLNDIDLWVEYIGQSYADNIGWNNRFSNGGWLDIDANMAPSTKEPVENIFWQFGTAPKGTYNVYLHYYRQWDSAKETSVLIRVVNGKQEEYKTQIMSGPQYNPIKVFSFTR